MELAAAEEEEEGGGRWQGSTEVEQRVVPDEVSEVAGAGSWLPCGKPPNERAIVEEAEEFNQTEELGRWLEAQKQAKLQDEAELQSAEVPEVFYVHEGNDHLEQSSVWKSLQEGAKILENKELLESTSYETLVSIKTSAQRLLETVDQGIHLAVERERYQVWQAATAARRQICRIESEALAICNTLRAEVAKISERERKTQELLVRSNAAVQKIGFGQAVEDIDEA